MRRGSIAHADAVAAFTLASAELEAALLVLRDGFESRWGSARTEFLGAVTRKLGGRSLLAYRALRDVRDVLRFHGVILLSDPSYLDWLTRGARMQLSVLGFWEEAKAASGE